MNKDNDSTDVVYQRADLGTLKSLLKVFGEVEDPGTYRERSRRCVSESFGDAHVRAVAAVRGWKFRRLQLTFSRI